MLNRYKIVITASGLTCEPAKGWAPARDRLSGCVCHATAACGRARSISALQAFTRSRISCVDCLHGPPLHAVIVHVQWIRGRL